MITFNIQKLGPLGVSCNLKITKYFRLSFSIFTIEELTNIILTFGISFFDISIGLGKFTKLK